METSFLLAIVKGIVLPTIAIFFLNRINIFDFISIVPSDSCFEFGLAAYLVLLECLYVKLMKFIATKKTQVECVFGCAGQNMNINSIPEMIFNNEVSYINVRVDISGNRKCLAKKKLLISLPEGLDVQVNSGKVLVENNICKLDIEKIINGNSNMVESTYYRFKIGIIKNYSRNEEDDGYGTEVIPELNNKAICNFKHNKLKIIWGD